MRDIKVALQEHYDKVKEKFPHTTILGVFLYGSQNYNIATEDSDVDTIAILVPSFDDLVLRTPISKEIHFENGEHCVIKDIREVVKQWKKQSLNYLEILFTDYFIVRECWKEDWNCFVEMREDIACMDMDKTIKSVKGQAIHTLMQGETNYKKQANALKMYYFLISFMTGHSYEDSLTFLWNKTLLVKKGVKPFPFESVASFKKALEELEKYEAYKTSVKNTYRSHKNVEETLDGYLITLIWRAITL